MAAAMDRMFRRLFLVLPEDTPRPPRLLCELCCDEYATHCTDAWDGTATMVCEGCLAPDAGHACWEEVTRWLCYTNVPDDGPWQPSYNHDAIVERVEQAARERSGHDMADAMGYSCRTIAPLTNDVVFLMPEGILRHISTEWMRA